MADLNGPQNSNKPEGESLMPMPETIVLPEVKPLAEIPLLPVENKSEAVVSPVVPEQIVSEKVSEVEKSHTMEVLNNQIALLQQNLKLIHNSCIEIASKILESKIFSEEEELMISGLLSNSLGRYEHISTIAEAQIAQIQKIGADHVKNESVLSDLNQKFDGLKTKLQTYQDKTKGLLDSLLKIREALPEKAADSKPEYERLLKQSLSSLNEFSLGYLRLMDVDSAAGEEKDRLNILFNLYNNEGFKTVSQSFLRAEDHFIAEKENLDKNLDLSSLNQADKELESTKKPGEPLVDENLRGLFLLKNLFDLNPELYKKVILNFQFLEQYKDDLKDLQPYLKMQTGYYDVNFLKNRVLELAKDDPGMVNEYLENKLEDLQEAYNKLLGVRKVKTVVSKPESIMAGEGAEEISDLKELEKASREISQLVKSGELDSDGGNAARNYLTDVVMTEKIKTEAQQPKMEVNEDADLVDDVLELKPSDIEYVDEAVTPVAKPKHQMPPLPAMQSVSGEQKVRSNDQSIPAIPMMEKVIIGEGAADEEVLRAEASKKELAEGIKELKNLESQRNFVENFWKNNKDLSDKLQYYQIMYRELKNMADTRAGEPVLDDLGQNLAMNLNSYIKENYGKKSEAEIIEDVTKQLEKNDEKLQDLYKMFTEGKTVSGELNVAPVEQTPVSQMPKLENVQVGEGANLVDDVLELKPEDIEYVDEAVTPIVKPKYPMPPVPAKKTLGEEVPVLPEKTSETISVFWEKNQHFKNQVETDLRGLHGSAMLIDLARNTLRTNGINQVGDLDLAQLNYIQNLDAELRANINQMIDNRGAKVDSVLKDEIRSYVKKVNKSLTALYKTLETAIANKKEAVLPSQKEEGIQMGDEDIVEETPIPAVSEKEKMEAGDWRKESVLDSSDQSEVMLALSNKLGSAYMSQKENLNEINSVYTDLEMSLSKPEVLAMVQAWFSENEKYPQYKNRKISKEAILNLFWTDIVDVGNISNNYQASRKLFAGAQKVFDFRNAVDLALSRVNTFVDQLNIWQETVYNKRKREPVQLPKTQFPTLFN